MLLVAFCAGIVIAPALYHTAHPHGFGTGESDGVIHIGDALSGHTPVCPMCQLHIVADAPDAEPLAPLASAFVEAPLVPAIVSVFPSLTLRSRAPPASLI